MALSFLLFLSGRFFLCSMAHVILIYTIITCFAVKYEAVHVYVKMLPWWKREVSGKNHTSPVRHETSSFQRILQTGIKTKLCFEACMFFFWWSASHLLPTIEKKKRTCMMQSKIVLLFRCSYTALLAWFSFSSACCFFHYVCWHMMFTAQIRRVRLSVIKYISG